MFGPEIGSQAYALFFTSSSISSLFFSIIVTNFQSTYGYYGIILLTNVTNLIAIVLLILLSERPLMYKKECLLWEPDSVTNYGPTLHECSVEFA